LSPHLPQWEVEPAALEAELRLARRALAPKWLKLVGGEPLLHSRLIECLEVAYSVDIAPIVSLTTNGFLLPRQPKEFWMMLNALTISLYPQPVLPEQTIVLVEARAKEYNVQLNWKRQDFFVQMDRKSLCEDETENAIVWDACWLRRRCNMVRDGRFYACTRPPHFGKLLQADFSGDGITLDERSSLAEEIQTYLQRREPLAACALCLGGNVKESPHRQLRAGEERIFAAG
jgi:cyclic pyranopterin phosphate synthase